MQKIIGGVYQKKLARTPPLHDFVKQNLGGCNSHTVATGILHYYDKGEISFEVAKDLLKIARNGVGFCAGNYSEAVACLDDRCGHCLAKSEDLLGAYDLPANYKDIQTFLKK